MVDFTAALLALAAEVRITRPQAWGEGVGEMLRLVGVRLKPRHNAEFVSAMANCSAAKTSFGPCH